MEQSSHLSQELQQQWDFIAWTARLRGVTRHNNATIDRKESVAEHSWHVALVCMVLGRQLQAEFGHELNMERMLKMAIIHDLVEVDAGDPSVWSATHSEGKAEREEAVAQRRFAQLEASLAAELLDLWHEYETGETPEAISVRGIDRLNPAMMRFLTGQGWQDVDGTTESLDHIQLPRIQFSHALRDLYEEVRESAVHQGLLRES